MDDPSGRLAPYEARTERALDLLALLTLWIVVVPPWDFGHDVEGIAWTIRIAVSVVYGIDLAIRGVLARRPVAMRSPTRSCSSPWCFRRSA